MMFAMGAVSSALDAIKSLTSSSSSSAPPAGSNEATNPFDFTGNAPVEGISIPAFGRLSQLSPATMSALLAAQSQFSTSASAPTSPANALQDLFSQIDAGGNGGISKSEFENALGAGGTNLAQADDVFSKLDTNGDGSVSLSELSSALKGLEGSGGHHHHVSGSSGSSDSTGAGTSSGQSTGGASSDPLLQALTGASATSVTNSNGSTTTSLTFADGSEVSMTSPAATTASSAATSSYNLLAQLIQREEQAISFSVTTPSFSLTA